MPDVDRGPIRVEGPASTEPEHADAALGSPTSPLRSPEAFEAYCLQVEAQLAARAAQRRQFLHDAYERLIAMLRAARAVEDRALIQEIREHCLTVRQLLGPGAPPEPQHALGPSDSALFANTKRTPGAAYPFHEAVTTAYPGSVHAAVFQGGQAAPADHSAQARIPRRAVRPISDIETDAAALREEIDDWSKRWPLQDEAGSLIAANCLRLRTIACRCRRLEAEAGDTSIAELGELDRSVRSLLEAADDRNYTVALDASLDPPPTAYQWGELADRYGEMAQAQEAFLWWRSQSQLVVADIQPLAESVAAIQQRFNRLLFRLGARDPFQQQLFDDLRAWAREAQCYLHSLRPKVPIAELVDRAATLEAAWQGARHAVDRDI